MKILSNQKIKTLVHDSHPKNINEFMSNTVNKRTLMSHITMSGTVSIKITTHFVVEIQEKNCYKNMPLILNSTNLSTLPREKWLDKGQLEI
jgi:hypothetical protein